MEISIAELFLMVWAGVATYLATGYHTLWQRERERFACADHLLRLIVHDKDAREDFFAKSDAVIDLMRAGEQS